MSIEALVGRPGIGPARTAEFRRVFASNFHTRFLPGGGILDGNSRDPGNTDNPRLLRPGLPVGRVTSSGEWRPSAFGVTQGALTGTATTVSLTAGAAAELVRRVGATGTFKLIGPPTTAGVVRSLTATYSAVNTSTGDVTITALGVSDVWTLTAPAGQDAGFYQLEVTTGLGTAAEVTKVTAALAANANTAAVDAAVEALSNVGAGGVVAVYSDPTLTLTFASNLGPVYVRVLSDTTNDGGVFEGGWAAVHTTTGVDGRFVTGVFAAPTDGSETPRSFVPDGTGILMTSDGSSDVDFPLIPIGGDVDSGQVINWPADASLKQWVVDAVNAPGYGRFSFDHLLST